MLDKIRIKTTAYFRLQTIFSKYVSLLFSMNSKRTSQTITEEWFNTISHGITALLAIAGLIVLIVYGATSDQSYSLFSALFYGISLVILYTASTLYHGFRKKRVKELFNIFDHMCIYLLIAGTYMPVLLLVIGGSYGWILFGIQWGMAITGIVLL